MEEDLFCRQLLWTKPPVADTLFHFETITCFLGQAVTCTSGSCCVVCLPEGQRKDPFVCEWWNDSGNLSPRHNSRAKQDAEKSWQSAIGHGVLVCPTIGYHWLSQLVTVRSLIINVLLPECSPTRHALILGYCAQGSATGGFAAQTAQRFMCFYFKSSCRLHSTLVLSVYMRSQSRSEGNTSYSDATPI